MVSSIQSSSHSCPTTSDSRSSHESSSIIDSISFGIIDVLVGDEGVSTSSSWLFSTGIFIAGGRNFTSGVIAGWVTCLTGCCQGGDCTHTGFGCLMGWGVLCTSSTGCKMMVVGLVGWKNGWLVLGEYGWRGGWGACMEVGLCRKGEDCVLVDILSLVLAFRACFRDSLGCLVRLRARYPLPSPCFSPVPSTFFSPFILLLSFASPVQQQDNFYVLSDQFINNIKNIFILYVLIFSYTISVQKYIYQIIVVKLDFSPISQTNMQMRQKKHVSSYI